MLSLMGKQIDIVGHGEEPVPWIRYTKDSQPVPLDSPVHSLQPVSLYLPFLSFGSVREIVVLCKLKEDCLDLMTEYDLTNTMSTVVVLMQFSDKTSNFTIKEMKDDFGR
ncbi:unnamed protein product [Caretta caretta]